MKIPTSGGIDGTDGILGDRGLYIKEAEHGRAVHCDTADSGPLREDGVEAGGMG